MSTEVIEYKIKTFREFSRPIEVSGLEAIVEGFSVAGCAASLKVKHVAVVETVSGIFGKSLVTIFGKKAEALKKKAKEEGVYVYGDPGQSERDDRVKSKRKPHGNERWHWYDTHTSDTSTSTIYWKFTS